LFSDNDRENSLNTETNNDRENSLNTEANNDRENSLNTKTNNDRENSAYTQEITHEQHETNSTFNLENDVEIEGT